MVHRSYSFAWLFLYWKFWGLKTSGHPYGSTGFEVSNVQELCKQLKFAPCVSFNEIGQKVVAKTW